MKKIPALYKQLHTKIEIIKFIDKFKFYLLFDLKNYFSLLEFIPQLVINSGDFLYKKRIINFDNINNYEIYQLLEFCDLQLIKTLHNNNLQYGLISFYPSIERDKNNTFIKSVSEDKILMMQKLLLIDANNDSIVKIANELISLINEIIKKINLHDTSIIPKKIETIEFSKLKKLYPTVSTNDAINELVTKKGCVLIFNLDNNLGHVNRKELLTFKNNATLYVKSDVNNKSIELFNFYICPKLEEILNKFQYDVDFMNNIDQLNEIFNNYNDLIGIEINFSRLLLYVLNKMHITEINNSPINEEIQKNFKTNKLFRF